MSSWMKVIGIQILMYCAFYFGSMVYMGKAEVHSDLKPLYNEVMDIIRKNCPNDYYKPDYVKVGFEKLNSVAYCMHLPAGFYIAIDKERWDNFDASERFQIMAHELFHCTLNVRHIDDPTHFMNPTMEYLKKEIVIEQMKTIMEKECKTI